MRERLTRKKVSPSYARGRGQVSTPYTSDATRQELVIRLAEYEDVGLMPEEIEALREQPDAGPGAMSAEDADVLEAYHTGRMVCPKSCATCGHYPDPLLASAKCEKTGQTTRRRQYCSEWIVGPHQNG